MEKDFHITKRNRDEDYLNWIRMIPCIVCSIQSGYVPITNTAVSEPHHVEKEHNAAKGMKADDSRAIPLCKGHHNIIHHCGKETFIKEYNVELEEIILNLNAIYERMKEYINER